MTEEQIEARAERQMDTLDKIYLTSGMEYAEYQRQVRLIEQGVIDALASLRRSK